MKRISDAEYADADDLHVVAEELAEYTVVLTAQFGPLVKVDGIWYMPGLSHHEIDGDADLRAQCPHFRVVASPS